MKRYNYFRSSASFRVRLALPAFPQAQPATCPANEADGER